MFCIVMCFVCFVCVELCFALCIEFSFVLGPVFYFLLCSVVLRFAVVFSEVYRRYLTLCRGSSVSQLVS